MPLRTPTPPRLSPFFYEIPIAKPSYLCKQYRYSSSMTRPSKPNHVLIIGTGLSSLTIAHTLLTHPSNISLQLTLIDKARLPGGRLTSRTYPNFTTLEPGARVFQSNSQPFHREAEKWAAKAWVKEVDHSQLRGVAGKESGERWWEGGEGGWSGSLIPGLVKEINEAGSGRVSWQFNTTVQPFGADLRLRTEPEIDVPPIDITVITSPTPQTTALLPTFTAIKPTTYLQSFTLLYPTISIPSTYPIYHRNPHPSTSVIATGTTPTSNTPKGLIIQATPQQLSLTYDRESTTDDHIRSAIHDVLGHADIPPKSVVQELSKVGEKDWQVKRWKFAQVEHPPGVKENGQFGITETDKGVFLVAGDGESERGGVEGAWYSGKAVAEWIIKRLS